MAKTLCPSCGYSPIPHGAEECPACHEPFAFVPAFKRARRMDRMAVPLGDEEGGATLMGGTVFTGAISVHPKQAVGVFVFGAFAWVMRASGAMGEQAAPSWTYALVGAALLSALLLYLRRGPSKLLAQFTALGMILGALFLAIPHLLQTTALMFAAHGVVSLVMVAGEPGTGRRWVGLGLGLLTAVLGMASLAIGPRPERPAAPSRRQELVSQEFGFRLALPPRLPPAVGRGGQRLSRAALRDPHRCHRGRPRGAGPLRGQPGGGPADRRLPAGAASAG